MRKVESALKGGILLSVLLFSITVLYSSSAYGQMNPPEDKTIDAKIQAEIIDSVCQAMNKTYVFPDVAKKMEKLLRNQYKNKKYAELTGLRDFTAKLTEDLQSISHDKHLRVIYVSDDLISRMQNDTLTDEAKEKVIEQSRRENYGFKEMKILDGNIGYVKFDRFADTENAGLTAIAVMNFLAYTDAIIFDLRDNGGGSPSMIQLILSYLFKEPEHINTFYVRETDSLQQFWTQEYVDGPKLLDTDIYVLTSGFTFSAAEEFTYDIKNLKRGTIIGETTGGGAHPNERVAFVGLNVGMSLPFGRAINPISGTNWEGTGVKPDIEVPRDKAFDTAYSEALKKLKDKTPDKGRQTQIQWTIDGLNIKLNPVNLEQAAMQKYVGTYGPRTITFRDGGLYYQREDRPEYALIPMGDNMFMLDGLDYFRLKFILDDGGRVNEVIGLYDDGHSDSNKRDK